MFWGAHQIFLAQFLTGPRNAFSLSFLWRWHIMGPFIFAFRCSKTEMRKRICQVTGNNSKWAPWRNCKVVSTLSVFPIPGILLENFCVTLLSLIKCSISETARPRKISCPFFWGWGGVGNVKKQDHRLQSADCKNKLIFFSQLSIQTSFCQEKVNIAFCSKSVWRKKKKASEDQNSQCWYSYFILFDPFFVYN